MFTVTVKMESLRYISIGPPPPFSPMPKAADAHRRRVEDRMDALGQALLEVAPDQRAHLPRAE